MSSRNRDIGDVPVVSESDKNATEQISSASATAMGTSTSTSASTNKESISIPEVQVSPLLDSGSQAATSLSTAACPIDDRTPIWRVPESGNIEDIAAGASSSSTQPQALIPTRRRASRRSNTHVASACINCKRAHLSCNVGRPCMRCVATDKQETCIDVAHKKRGRPSKRRDLGSQQRPSPVSLPATPTTLFSDRQTLTPPHRRTNSLQSIVSRSSEAASTQQMSSAFPANVTTGHFPNPQQSSDPLLSPLMTVDQPWAFLNLDSVFLSANTPFKNLFTDGQEIRGRRLSEVVTAVNEPNLPTLFEDIRSEQWAHGQRLQSTTSAQCEGLPHDTSELDVYHLEQGFTDRICYWRPFTNFTERPCRVQVRMVKTNDYLVAVTVPESHLRPLTQRERSASGSAESQRAYVSPQLTEAPPYMPPRTGVVEPPAYMITSGQRTAPLDPRFLQPQQYRPPLESIGPYERMTGKSAAVSASGKSSETAHQSQAEAQTYLPPMKLTPETMSASPSSRPSHTTAKREFRPGDNDDDNGSRTGPPAKRRRLDIQDVLHH